MVDGNRMKNLDVTLAQLPLIAIGGYFIYQAIVYFQEYIKHPTGGPTSTFVFLISIGVILLGMALGLQEIRKHRLKKEVFMAKEYNKEVAEKERKEKPITAIEEKEIEETEPISILKIRYAKGEITEEEYEEMKKVLEES